MGKELNNRLKQLMPFIAIILVVLTVFIGGIFYLKSNPGLFLGQTQKEEDPVPEKMVQVDENEEIVGGVHPGTGLVEGEGLDLVIAHCTGCHSSKLITQNRAEREGWIQMIRWMQETQNLWDLGEHEEAIVSYLAKYYAPEEKGRRAPLTDIEWYELKE
jgi:hypothetical protein